MRLSAVAVSSDVDLRAIVMQLEGTSATIPVKAAEDAAKPAVLEDDCAVGRTARNCRGYRPHFSLFDACYRRVS